MTRREKFKKLRDEIRLENLKHEEEEVIKIDNINYLAELSRTQHRVWKGND